MQKSKVSPVAKLTPATVRRIRRLKGHSTQMELAAQFNVSQATISKIYNGKVYKDV